MAGNYTRFPASGGGGSSSSPSVGTTGAPVPTYTDQVGGNNPSGNLQAISITTAGAVKTDSSATVQPISATALPLPSGAAQDGTDATGVTAPSGGVGIRGWLSGIYKLLSNPLAVSGTVSVSTLPALTAGSAAIGTVGVTALPALPTGANTIGSISNISGTISLPTGAATSAAQTTAQASLTTIATNSGTQATAALQTSGNSSLSTIATNSALTGKSVGTAISNAPVYNAYSTTSVTTSTYVQMIASTTAATNTVDVFDSSGQAMILGIGGSGSEVASYYIPPGGDLFRLAIPAGSRVSLRALTGSATSGYVTINLLQ